MSRSLEFVVEESSVAKIVRSRMPFTVSSAGAANNLRACSSPSAGVEPSLPLAAGRFTPSTGLPTTALRSHR